VALDDVKKEGVGVGLRLPGSLRLEREELPNVSPCVITAKRALYS